MENFNKIYEYSLKEFAKYISTLNIDDLIDIKNYADNLYYNTDNNSLHDWQYDMIAEKIKTLDSNIKLPVGAKIRDGENKVKLPFWLGSMNKFTPKDSKELNEWIKKYESEEYIIQEKLDGVSCLFTVKNNKLKLYTRGDGDIGSDISHIDKYINGIPKLNSKLSLNVRGELIMKEKVFKENYSEKYANARNMVAGRIGGKTLREGINNIDFVAYEIIYEDKKAIKPSEQLKYLKSLGFKTVFSEIIDSFNINILKEKLALFSSESEYKIDGIIVQPNLPYKRNTSGNPSYAFAFKMMFADNVIQATVIRVEWNISKWGQIKPRVEIKPVKLGGVTITWASGFNAKFIRSQSIGPGAIIDITRSGDVIPFIIRVVKKAKEPDLPKDIDYKWNETFVDIYTESLQNEACIKLISSFFSKIGAKYLGEKNVEKIYNSGFNTIIKIISASKEDFLKVPTFKNRMAELIYKNIHTALENTTLPILLGSSGIFEFGMGRKKIIALFDDFPDILKKYKNMTKKQLYERILKVNGYSDISATKIVDNIEYADEFYNKIKKYVLVNSKVNSKIIKEKDLKLSGKTIVFTGFRDKNLENKIIEAGGKVTGSVSKKTSILIVKEKDGKISNSRKKAIDLGIEILTKQEFIDKYI